jgi:hypothetical protein
MCWKNCLGLLSPKPLPDFYWNHFHQVCISSLPPTLLSSQLLHVADFMVFFSSRPVWSIIIVEQNWSLNSPWNAFFHMFLRTVCFPYISSYHSGSLSFLLIFILSLSP